MARTTTPGSTAPVASTTCPLSVASCAEAMIGNANTPITKTARTTRGYMESLLSINRVARTPSANVPVVRQILLERHVAVFAERGFLDLIVGSEREDTRVQVPGFGQHLGILDRHLPRQRVSLPGEPLNHAGVLGVKHSSIAEPGVIGQVPDVDDQRVLLPVAD